MHLLTLPVPIVLFHNPYRVAPLKGDLVPVMPMVLVVPMVPVVLMVVRWDDRKLQIGNMIRPCVDGVESTRVVGRVDNMSVSVTPINGLHIEPDPPPLFDHCRSRPYLHLNRYDLR